MLDLPMIQKLNLKLSSWVMSKVEVSQKAIIISGRKTLKFSSADVGMVFGIPSGNRDVLGPDGNINEESISFIKKTLGMDLASSHSLRSAEAFLKRDITDQSSKIEKECFQIAFVIFVMGHVLAPSCKHDYKTIDFWGALSKAENIPQFNWCDYVMQCLLDAVTKLKMDIKNGVSTTNLTGGHLFLQVNTFLFQGIIHVFGPKHFKTVCFTIILLMHVFYLDNLDLGIFNKKHDVLPRVNVFDQDTLRKMATMATDVGLPEPSFSSAPLRDPSTVCYSRSRPQKEPVTPSMSAPLASNNPLSQHQATARKTVPCRPPTNANQQLSPAISPRQLSALDYSNHIARHFPLVSKQPIAVLLCEQNARAIRHVTTARHNIQTDMVNFTDKLFAALAANCTCCAARGFSDCPLQFVNDSATPKSHTVQPEHSHPSSSNNMSNFNTPVSDKIQGVRLQLSDDEESSSQRQRVLKRPRCSGSSLVKAQTSVQKCPVIHGTNDSSMNEEICAADQKYARCILASIKDIYADCIGNESSSVIFGVNCAAIPKRKILTQLRIQPLVCRASGCPRTNSLRRTS
ncbi:uncharacterized protein LOC125520167 isoform X1 [Triticum urartu]|uniref:uncharacterized protein LOC125520167 isoform X1 n=1 Tax=Triticum urartu TaxID=4572 RepID=UPI002042EF3D|nr:uncharacterized protein LOC125520167 isoform X1 [Triticum urartu]